MRRPDPASGPGRLVLPPASSPFIEANYLQNDGLIAVLDGQYELAASYLCRAASYFENEGLRYYAAITWLQYAWAALEIDHDAACRAAQAAYAHMTAVGFGRKFWSARLFGSAFSLPPSRKCDWPGRPDPKHPRTDKPRSRAGENGHASPL